MELFGTGIAYKKIALGVSGVGLLLTLACGTSAAPIEPSANKETSSASPANNNETIGVPPANNETSGEPPANNETSGEPPANNVTSGAPPANNVTSGAPPANNVTSGAPPANNKEGLSPDSALTEPAAPVVAPDSAASESIPVSYTIGNDVGQRIPDFAITLGDGSTVTSADLLAQRQPTFLFFFETW